MDKVVAFLKENWQFTIMGIGALFLIGAIFNINFIIDRQGSAPTGFLTWFGEKGYRIIVGIGGIGLISYGLISLV